MIDKEILRKVMEKACDNSSRIMKNIMHHGNDFDILLDFYKNIIFEPSFAKAFWGEDTTCFHCHGDSKDWIEGTCPECFCNPKYRSKWKYNLQQMVLEEEPLKYLEKFL